MNKILPVIFLFFSASVLFSQNVNIPDPNFKTYLVGNYAINTNFDAEIQVAEASAFAGRINISSSSVSDLTGLEAFTSLTSFNCSYNSISNLNLSFLTTLVTLECNNNSLTTLDLSFLPNLDTLACQNNPLTFLNVANGNNGNITYFNALPNSSLTCIKVDDAAYSAVVWTLVDPASTFISKVDTPSNVTVCGAYTLPSLTIGDYYTGSGSSGTALFSGNVITTTQTIYIYKSNGACFDESSFLVTINPLPSVNAGVDQSKCEGDNIVLGGTGAVTYSWDNGVTDGVSFLAVAGFTTYNVIGTDANGCQNSDLIDVTVNGLPSVDAGFDQTLCENTPLTLSGGGAQTYTWDNGVTDGSPFFPTVGTTNFTVTGTDANGCVNTDQIGITVNALPSVDAGLNQTVCFAGDVILAGNGTNFYAWDNGISDGVIFNPTSTSLYVLTGTDLNGCNNTDTVLVTVLALPSVNAGADQTLCESQNITLSGSGAFSYSWDFGVTDGVPFTHSPGLLTFTVTGTDVNGCVNTDQIDVLVHALPSVFAGSDIIACQGDSITLSGFGAGIYSWDNGILDNTPFTKPNGTTTFTVTGTDANGCVNTDQVDVTFNALPNINAGVDQTVCENDLITLVCSGVVSLAWDNSVFDNTPFFQPVGTVIYTVTGSDANGCTSSDQVSVTVNALPTVNAGIDQSVCEFDNIIISASGAVTYSWDNGVSDSIPFTQAVGVTTYTVTGTDANGCVNTDQVDVTVNALPSVFAGVDISACQNDSVTLVASGANTYAWDNGIFNNTPFTYSNGTTTFTVTGTDASGCSNTDQVDVTFNALPTVDAGIDQTVCENDLITLAASGASSLTWDNGVFDNTPFTQAVGTTVYSVIGYDANGCGNTDQVSVTVIPLPIVNAGIDQSVCEFENIVISASGATSFSWDNGVFDSIPFTQGVGVTTYTVTGTTNGCSSTDQVDITVNALPAVNAGNDQTLCENASVTLSGLGASTYSWDNGAIDNISFTQAVGTTTYTVTGTDGNGCVNSDQVNVTVNALPIANAGADQTLCDNINIILAGSGAAILAWDNSVTNNIPFTQAVGTTTYTLTVTDVNGCSSSDQIDVTVNALPPVDAGPDFEGCDNVSITLAGNGAQTYLWNNGVIDNAPFTPVAGSFQYVLTGTDVNGCSNNDTIMVTINPEPTINVSASIEICENDEIALTATSSSPFIFWYDQASGGNVISQSGNYISNDIVTDSIVYVEAIENGCSSVRTPVQITVNPKPVIAISSTNSDCGLNNGTASATISQGTLPYSNFYWSSGEQNVLNISNLPTGSYYFNVEDVKGCKAIAVTEVIPNTISITPTIVDPACNGEASGSITLNITGTSETLSYFWSTGHQSQNVSNLKAGSYEVTVTTASNCSFTSSFVLTDLDPISNLVNELKPSCGNTDGSLEVISTSGGQSGYTYSWTNGVNGTQNMNIGFGVYTLTTTDNNGCQHMKTYYLSESNAPSIVGTVSETDCGASNGAINVDLTPQIGDTISMVSWSNGAFTEDISNLSNGNYICTAKASNNCSAIRGWNLNVKKPDLQEICVVSVDSVTTTNLVIWEKVQTSGVSHYNIYRESNQIDEYQLIDTVQFTNLSVFNDVVASPNARSWRYRISAVDMCGVEGNLSAAHKTLHLNSFDLGASGVNITWDQYEGSAFSSYLVSRFTDANGWENIASLPTSDLNYTDTASATTPGLDYMVEISLDQPCTATTWRAQDFNRSRSNKERGIFSPGEGTGEFSNNEIYEIKLGDLSLNIYPNPFDNQVFLNLNGIENLNIRITNINGIEVANQLCKTGLNNINLENLSNGMYFIVFENQFNLEAIKIVKK